jgi:hypothetical protein
MKRKRKKRNPLLHAQQCSICRSPDRERVESDYVSWVAASKICKRYRIKSRTTLYRHVQALALTERRDTNIKGFLRSVIDRGQNVKLTATAVMQAVVILTKLDSDNRWVDISQRRVTHPLFERMSPKELLTLAKDGVFPAWMTVSEKKELLG